MSGGASLTRGPARRFAALAAFVLAGFAGAPTQAADRFAPIQIAPASFDFYILALSWAPSFCAGRDGARAGAECAPGAGFGFVLHGLWPQNEQGSLNECDAGEARLPRAALDQARALYPSLGLARHEWRAHGACLGLAPSAYLAAVSVARAAVRTPPQFENVRETQTLAPRAVQNAFLAANQRLRPGMFAITCRRGLMQEARFCLTKDLRAFRPCAEATRTFCRSATMSVPAPQ